MRMRPSAQPTFCAIKCIKSPRVRKSLLEIATHLAARLRALGIGAATRGKHVVKIQMRSMAQPTLCTTMCIWSSWVHKVVFEMTAHLVARYAHSSSGRRRGVDMQWRCCCIKACSRHSAQPGISGDLEHAQQLQKSRPSWPRACAHSASGRRRGASMSSRRGCVHARSEHSAQPGVSEVLEHAKQFQKS